MSGQLSENQRGHNGLAIAACCVGLGSLLFISVGMAGLLELPIRALIPLLLVTGCAVVLGAVGLRQIKANGQRGRGLAIAGCGAGAAGFLVMSVVFGALTSGLAG
ncbi:hypothetical protein GA0074695_6371 [Micromonospora viridifaciens]|uniref:DUF4190 domain-containing protein n=1 Tax=Micromonospora viridifaciens TaxID=1881 RepID=A0A1C4ZZD5_MICVI|nr:hypothetical protein [Micromonospora viridifaciens]SCF38295.1 hypothetical protein GA0074695_6371 [Micromonospora viridifaciens]